MSEDKISKADVLSWLYNKISNLERQFRKPTHGTCCTCQICGNQYDDCVCFDLRYFRQICEEIK